MKNNITTSGFRTIYNFVPNFSINAYSEARNKIESMFFISLLFFPGGGGGGGGTYILKKVVSKQVKLLKNDSLKYDWTKIIKLYAMLIANHIVLE